MPTYAHILIAVAVIMIVETRYRGRTDTEVYDFGRRELDALMAAFGHAR